MLKKKKLTEFMVTLSLNIALISVYGKILKSSDIKKESLCSNMLATTGIVVGDRFVN